MNFLMSVGPTLIILGVLITIHEFGHFIACRLTRVRVEKFSIGFGPEIVHWQGGETRFAISLFPLGGYVKPAGESYSELPDGQEAKPGEYLAAPLPSRIFIVCAGVIMNYALAFVLFAAIFMMGRPVPGTTIGSFVEGYPAASSGLLKGDKIAAIAERPVQTWGELMEAIESAPAGPLAVQVERKNLAGGLDSFAVVIEPKVEDAMDLFGKQVQARRLGITPHPEAAIFEKYGFAQSLSHAAQTTTYLTVMTHKAIFYMIMGKMSLKSVSGPVGIVTMAGDAAKMGVTYILQLMATLSISLAVINLLPIPALDGGHLLFLLIEAVRRKRVSLVFQERVTQAGFAALLILMAFLIFNDLNNLNVFGRIRGLFGA